MSSPVSIGIAVAIARLQLASVPYVAELGAAGCLDRGLDGLSLGLFLGGGEPGPLFGAYTVEWLENVIAALDRLG